MKEIGSGAEATIYLDGTTVLKERKPKRYRLKEIDETLRKTRTKIEAKILKKLPIKGPELLKTDSKATIEMKFIDGKKVRDLIDKNPFLAKEIGLKLAKMHDFGIIHGDLTTSNMILQEEIYFIDFGLSYFSKKEEDKAVDIHLFKQALESKHYKIAEQAYKEFLKGYNQSINYKQVMERLRNVELRGRYKHK